MPNVNDRGRVIVGNTQQSTVEILTGQTTSPVIFCDGNSFIAMELSATFTPGNIIFLASLNNVDFYQLTDFDVDLVQLSQASIVAAIAAMDASAQGLHIPLDPALFAGVQFLKIICSVAQAADQKIQFAMAPVLGS